MIYKIDSNMIQIQRILNVICFNICVIINIILANQSLTFMNLLYYISDPYKMILQI